LLKTAIFPQSDVKNFEDDIFIHMLSQEGQNKNRLWKWPWEKKKRLYMDISHRLRYV